jgi:hypothetical protein
VGVDGFVFVAFGEPWVFFDLVDGGAFGGVENQHAFDEAFAI